MQLFLTLSSLCLICLCGLMNNSMECHSLSPCLAVTACKQPVFMPRYCYCIVPCSSSATCVEYKFNLVNWNNLYCFKLQCRCCRCCRCCHTHTYMPAIIISNTSASVSVQFHGLGNWAFIWMKFNWKQKHHFDIFHLAIAKKAKLFHLTK